MQVPGPRSGDVQMHGDWPLNLIATEKKSPARFVGKPP